MIIIYDLFQEVEYSECSVLKILKMLKKEHSDEKEETIIKKKSENHYYDYVFLHCSI